jgi:hypothetical protein
MAEESIQVRIIETEMIRPFLNQQIISEQLHNPTQYRVDRPPALENIFDETLDVPLAAVECKPESGTAHE